MICFIFIYFFIIKIKTEIFLFFVLIPLILCLKNKFQNIRADATLITLILKKINALIYPDRYMQANNFVIFKE